MCVWYIELIIARLSQFIARPTFYFITIILSPHNKTFINHKLQLVYIASKMREQSRHSHSLTKTTYNSTSATTDEFNPENKKEFKIHKRINL